MEEKNSEILHEKTKHDEGLNACDKSVSIELSSANRSEEKEEENASGGRKPNTGPNSSEDVICRIEKVGGNYHDFYETSPENTSQDFPITIEEVDIKEIPASLDTCSKVTLKRKSDSLALISSYNLSSDSDNELTSNAFTKLQAPIEIIDSNSDTESESGSIFNIESDASNESSQSSDGEAPDNENSKVKKNGNAGATSSKVLSCLDLGELPPIKDLHISVKEEECLPFGKVHSIVETLVVIESLPDVPALNLESVLFTKSGEPVGEVFDVFGPVKRPYYTIRFNSQKDIEEKLLAVGSIVYCAPKTKYTQYVFIHQLARLKGSDASWKNDMEPPPDCLDYSDDEQEKLAKKAIKETKLKAKAMKVIDVDAPPSKIPSFEERMNQRNTLRNQMFIRNPSPDRRQKDWYCNAGGFKRRDSGSSGSSGLIRNAGFTPPFQRHSSPHAQRIGLFSPHNRPTSSTLLGSPFPFEGSPRLTPSGFVASRSPFCGQFSGVRQARSTLSQPQIGSPFGPVQQQPQFGSSIHGTQFARAQSTNHFGQSQACNPFGPIQPNRFGAQGGPSFGQTQFGQPQPNGSAPFTRQPLFQPQYSKPFIQNPGSQFPPHTPSFQFGGSPFPPAPHRAAPQRPLAGNSPPYIPSPFSFPTNHSPQPNPNVSFPANMFSNNGPFTQYRPYKPN